MVHLSNSIQRQLEAVFPGAGNATAEFRELARLIAFSLQHGNDLVAWFTSQGRFIYANKAYCERVGYALEELLGMSVYEINPQAPHLYDEHWQEMRERGSIAFESVHRTKSGRTYPVEIVAKYVRCGHLECNATFTRDIGRQKEMEERLRITLFAVDHATDLISWVDADGRFAYVSKTMAERLGYEPHDLLGKHVLDVNLAVDDSWDMYWQRLKENGSLTFAARYRAKDGSIFPVESVATHVVYEGKEYSLGVSRDVGERRRVEREAQLIAHAIEKANLGVIRLSRDGRIREVNECICRLLGYTRSELLRMSAFDITVGLDPKDWPSRWEKLQELRHTTFEKEYRHKDGHIVPVEISDSALLELDGEELIHAFVRDLSERKQAEAILREREEQLQQAQKLEAIGRLAGGIAHDFNNLLTTIIGYSELILATGDLAGRPTEDDLGEVKRAAERAAALTSQILAFSRRQSLQPQVIALNDLIEETVPFLHRTLGEDIEFVTRLSHEPGAVEVDPHQFMQVLMNLAVNARDAMPAGGRLVLQTDNVELDELECNLTDPELVPGAYVKMVVADTGVGIDPSHLPHLFEPFFTTKGPNKGTGLGLATAYGIIKQSGGTVTVDSTPGSGATFTLLLPRTRREPTLCARTASPSPIAVPKCTVLLVEDEEAVRTLVERVLIQLGCTVYAASTGAQALAMLKSGEFLIDLLITDIVLPGALYGTDIARLASQMIDDLAVLFLSGYAQDVISGDLQAELSAPLLQKPFTPAEFSAKVRQVLEGTAIRSTDRDKSVRHPPESSGP